MNKVFRFTIASSTCIYPGNIMFDYPLYKAKIAVEQNHVYIASYFTHHHLAVCHGLPVECFLN